MRVERHRGTVAELHALDPFAGRCEHDVPVVWWCDPTDAAIVLGSRQSAESLDHEAVSRAGLEVVRRRSGGGAVVVHDEVVWIDLVVPVGDVMRGVTRDVRGSMVWAGERWRGALAELGVPSDRMTVHTGGLVETPWSPLVCFAGFGPGEVLLDGRKLVGLSQRRTRHGARIQGQVHRSGSLRSMPLLFAPPIPASPLDDAAEWPGLVAADVADALAATVAHGR